MFGLGGRPAHATVVERRLVAKSFDGSVGQSFSAYEYMLDVHPDDNSPAFRATIKDPFNMITWRQPDLGDTVQVKYHANHEIKWDRDDPRLHQDTPQQAAKKAVAAAHTAEEERRWADLASSGPGPRPTHDVSTERAAARVAPKPTASDEYLAMAEAVNRAKAEGNQDEVDRLKAEFKRLAMALLRGDNAPTQILSDETIARLTGHHPSDLQD